MLELGGAMGWMDGFPEDETMVAPAAPQHSSSNKSDQVIHHDSGTTINMCGGRGHFLERPSAVRIIYLFLSDDLMCTYGRTVPQLYVQVEHLALFRHKS